MLTALRTHVLPAAQRRTLDELTEDLDLRHGDTTAKRSAFWTMLVLSAVIATAGVLADSTATVIGAMIIAPLSTPIMGIALAVVKRQRNGSVRYVVLGALLVVAVGASFSWALPGSYDLLDNSQVAGRVSPRLVDLAAALATGLAGAVALARRDVAAVLPGVAIAISLVPPLAVVGVCLGHGSGLLAAGALVLFLSNLVALVLAGMFVFTVLAYRDATQGVGSVSPRRTYATLAVLSVTVLVPLALNSAFSYYVAILTTRVEDAATSWLGEVPGASVESVDLSSVTFRIEVRTRTHAPPTDTLMKDLEGSVPDGFRITVVTTLGEEIDAGTTGG
ncbi:DUF389 domain-containing protein [Nocardioides euryhalodurans]|uniref:DUF389 domain-containing protein n=1 Tax=Nocardioides euryhalodurans TaxID=2518370 RepID=A0A4P7GLQ4_9ACTN|nr:DUF389 domain-containing protein [Nocardioides euryhalodurans]QBR92657.1 DUF389 domain-containing protein [Nocardioides euryhalodurans]